mmetsp:Transcript_52019/g.165892  ORF Transcript_52019/g.165892 Transcript_52019/m.165892 type:complete len:225 (+) Transcript_52019:173-847(+)
MVQVSHPRPSRADRLQHASLELLRQQRGGHRARARARPSREHPARPGVVQHPRRSLVGLRLHGGVVRRGGPEAGAPDDLQRHRHPVPQGGPVAHQLGVAADPGYAVGAAHKGPALVLPLGRPDHGGLHHLSEVRLLGRAALHGVLLRRWDTCDDPPNDGMLRGDLCGGHVPAAPPLRRASHLQRQDCCGIPLPPPLHGPGVLSCGCVHVQLHALLVHAGRQPHP